ncbi:MAG: DNA polymerase domain-containing protein, partial [Rudaea sp.]
DPGEAVAWTDVVAAANAIRARLHAFGLESFVRLTGGKGLHVVAPVTIGPEWAQVKRFCENFADALVGDRPDIYIASAAKARRRHRIFVDWLRNVRGATSVASWSLRAHVGAPVAMPLRWDELGSVEGPKAYDLATALRRCAALKRDPWAGLGELRQHLPV